MPVLLTKQFQQASEILERIELHGHNAYFVGGCVRDLLLGRKIGDIDIASSASPDVIQEIFSKVIPVGLEHGTVIVRHKHQSFEVTTFRVDDDYTDQRHPDSVQFVQTIDQDLKRRDFTINALAMDKSGRIIDPFNGQEDIKAGIIRTVGNGYERLMEDPLRIMRALRFSSQLGFLLEENTLDAMRALSKEIETIAMERIIQETAKLFAGSYVNKGMYYFKTINIARHLPILQEHPHIIKQLPKEIKPLKSFGAVLALLHYNEPTITIQDWARQWKCSNKVKYEAEILNEALLHYQQDGLDRCIVYRLFEDSYSDFTALVKMLFKDTITNDFMKQIAHLLPIQSKKDLAINGMDLRRLFPDKNTGPWIGEALDEIEKQVISGHLSNDKNVLKEWVKWNLHETD